MNVDWIVAIPACFVLSLSSMQAVAGGFAGPAPAVNGKVFSVAEDEQGMILMSGDFTAIDERTIPRAARLNPDGRLDSSFHADPDGTLRQIFPRPGGGFLALGAFNRIGGGNSPMLAALLPNGRLDPAVSFRLQTRHKAGLMQPGGALVIAGNPLSIAGIARGPLVRFLPNGDLDPNFRPAITGSLNGVQAITGGRLLIWGDISAVDGVARDRLAVLNPDGGLDPSFVPPAFAGLTQTFDLQVTAQPDGKILMAGPFSSVDEIPTRGMVRLLPSGARDTTFSADFTSGSTTGTVRTISVRQDGMILAGGSFRQVNGANHNYAVRLHPDGTPDPTWHPNPNAAVHSIAIQDTGGVLLSGDFTTTAVDPRAYVAGESIPGTESRLLLEGANTVRWIRSGSLAALEGVRFEFFADGATTWTDLGPGTPAADGWQLLSAASLSSGTLRAKGTVLGGRGSLRSARRQVGDAAPVLILETIPGQPLEQDTGVIDFDGLPGPPATLSRDRIVTLSNQGSGLLEISGFSIVGPHAADFNLNRSGPTILAPGESGQILISFSPRGAGTRMASLEMSQPSSPSPVRLSLRGEGTTGLVSAVFRHAEEPPLVVEATVPGLELGPLTLGFHPLPGTVLRLVDNRHPSASSSLFKGIQPQTFLTTSYEGMTYQFMVSYTGGSGTSLGNDVELILAGPGTLRRRIPESTVLASRADGRLVMAQTDLTATRALILTSRTGSPEAVLSVPDAIPQNAVVRDDGRLLVVENIASTSTRQLSLLLPDGGADPAFPGIPLPYSQNTEQLAVGPDGTVYISTLHPSGTGLGLVRLAPGATIPTPFGPAMANNLSGARSIGALAVQPDGKVLVGSGTVAFVWGHSDRRGMLRLLPDGSLDPSFTASLPPGSDAGVTRILLQPDGRILICGEFGASPGVSFLGLQRLLPDGTLDPSFTPSIEGPTRAVSSMALQADGKILVAGDFTMVDHLPRTRLARLLSNGRLDPEFKAEANQFVKTLSLTPTGEIAIAGDFTILNSTSMGRGALLENSPPVQSLNVALSDGPLSAIRWLRGGSLPEADQVSFEVSAGGSAAAWTSLGSASRIAGGWEITAVALPPAGRIRARARFSSGFGGGSSGLQEMVVSYPVEKTIRDRWREDWFGSSENSGDAADHADPDHDGLPNFLEFALSSNPLKGKDASPPWVRSGLYSSWSLEFTAPEGAEDFEFTAEWAADLSPSGGWQASRDLGRRPDRIFRETITNRPQQFGRLSASLPAKVP